MNFSIQWLNVQPYLDQRKQPVIALKRPMSGNRPDRVDIDDRLFGSGQRGRTGTFWVPVSSLLDPEIKWSSTTQGESVRVPLIGYTTPVKAKSCILSSGLEMGMRAVASLASQTRKQIVEVIVVLGTEVHALPKAYQCYVGLALRVE